MHDLRRTASTLLHKAGFNTDWIEKCLAYDPRGAHAVYNKAEHAEQGGRCSRRGQICWTASSLSFLRDAIGSYKNVHRPLHHLGDVARRYVRRYAQQTQFGQLGLI